MKPLYRWVARLIVRRPSWYRWGPDDWVSKDYVWAMFNGSDENAGNLQKSSQSAVFWTHAKFLKIDEKQRTVPDEANPGKKLRRLHVRLPTPEDLEKEFRARNAGLDPRKVFNDLPVKDDEPLD